MNILYGIAFLALIYYLIQWKNITNNLKNKLQNQHTIINNKIQERLQSVKGDTRLIEGFTDAPNIFSRLKVKVTDERNNCNSIILPSAYSGLYSNEITEGLFNYASMKKEINL